MGKGAASLGMLKDRVKKATWSGRVAVLVAGLALLVMGLVVLAAGLEAEVASSSEATAQGDPNEQPPESRFGQDGDSKAEAAAQKKPPPKKLLWAVVDENGTLVRDKGALEASALGNGAFEVLFDRNVRGCSYQATIGRPEAVGATAPTGHVSASPRTSATNGLFVQTNDLSNNFVGRPFHVAVFCS